MRKQEYKLPATKRKYVGPIKVASKIYRVKIVKQKPLETQLLLEYIEHRQLWHGGSLIVKQLLNDRGVQ